MSRGVDPHERRCDIYSKTYAEGADPFVTMVFAYLDPGSGSALVGTLIAVAGAGLYSLKSFFYRLVRKPTPEEVDADKNANPDIAIFSEGKNYWGTFKDIVDELISRKVHFAYYTLDLHDPALLIDNEYVHSHLFDSNKAATFHKLSKIKARVLMATTPNIGTPGYPLARPAGVGSLVHVFHAFADISAYHVGSLDNYDKVLMVGSHQEKPIREVERARSLKPKKLMSVGLPYFDNQYNSLKSSNRSVPLGLSGEAKTILVAPSWGAKGLLTEYGTGFMAKLAEAGFNVIVRPHPQSYIAEADLVDRCKAETARFTNVAWDSETVGTRAMLASDMLISDTSSIRFDYAFLYGKPVVTLDIPREKQLEYEGQFMSEIWTDSAAKRLGRVAGHDDIANIVSIVKDVLESGAAEGVRKFRDETIANLGVSAKFVVDELCLKL